MRRISSASRFGKAHSSLVGRLSSWPPGGSKESGNVPSPPTSLAVPSRGFAPISNAEAQVLILGTLPGQISLSTGEYYAHPRNGFWRIIRELFALSPDMPYREATNALASAGVALWDVCAAAHRPGSLDSSIRPASVAANDFGRFFRTHPKVKLVCFNGAKARALYRREVLPNLEEPAKSIHLETLPSTSPAHASMRYEDKRTQWSIIRAACDRPS